MTEAPGAGWGPASIRIITTGGEERHDGWQKGSFGIIDHEVETRQAGWLPVASLTHLGTGWRVAAFDDAKTAAIAADLAEPLADWSTLCDPTSSKNPAWRSVKDRMVALWNDAGICQCSTTEDGKPVWTQVPEQSEAGHESRL
jgi:hypothetical protein